MLSNIRQNNKLRTMVGSSTGGTLDITKLIFYSSWFHTYSYYMISYYNYTYFLKAFHKWLMKMITLKAETLRKKVWKWSIRESKRLMQKTVNTEHTPEVYDVAEDSHIGFSWDTSSSFVHSFLSPHRARLGVITASLLSSGYGTFK